MRFLPGRDHNCIVTFEQKQVVLTKGNIFLKFSKIIVDSLAEVGAKYLSLRACRNN
jgi:hypothetical protein